MPRPDHLSLPSGEEGGPPGGCAGEPARARGGDRSGVRPVPTAEAAAAESREPRPVRREAYGPDGGITPSCRRAEGPPLRSARAEGGGARVSGAAATRYRSSAEGMASAGSHVQPVTSHAPERPGPVA
ncbi:hypothetical protein GCM10023079_15240 [Streptomyces chitinivorans]